MPAAAKIGTTKSGRLHARAVPPRERCPHCDYALKRLYLQQTGTTASGNRKTQAVPSDWLACSHCKRVYAESASGGVVETAPARIPSEASRAIESSALQDVLEHVEAVIEDLPPATGTALRRKLDRLREQT